MMKLLVEQLISVSTQFVLRKVQNKRSRVLYTVIYIDIIPLSYYVNTLWLYDVT